MSDGPPPQSAVMQMMMGAWSAQTVATVTRLDVPDLLHEHGALSARKLCDEYGVDAKPEFLERALRTCASLGVFTEAADGRFGLTPLSEVLTLDAPGSVKRFVEKIGGPWWKVFTGLPDAIRTGRNQAKAQLGVEPWKNPDLAEIEAFAEAMKSRVDSTAGVVEHCELSSSKEIVDVGGSLGHLSIAILDRHPQLRATVLDLPELMPIAERHAADAAPEVRARLTFLGTQPPKCGPDSPSSAGTCFARSRPQTPTCSRRSSTTGTTRAPCACCRTAEPGCERAAA